MWPLQDKEYYPNIRRCLISGFFMQVACLESEKRGAYSMLREGQDPGTPKNVVGSLGLCELGEIGASSNQRAGKSSLKRGFNGKINDNHL